MNDAIEKQEQRAREKRRTQERNARRELLAKAFDASEVSVDYDSQLSREIDATLFEIELREQVTRYAIAH